LVLVVLVDSVHQVMRALALVDMSHQKMELNQSLEVSQHLVVERVASITAVPVAMVDPAVVVVGQVAPVELKPLVEQIILVTMVEPEMVHRVAQVAVAQVLRELQHHLELVE
jgi:hypothetical protein